MARFIIVTFISLLFSSALAGDKPIRQGAGNVKMTRFKIVQVSDGYEIYYDDLCRKTVSLPVYDFRDSNEPGFTVPERTYVSCESSYFGKKVFVNAGLLIYLEKEDAFQTGTTTELKTFFTESSVSDQYGIEVFRRNVHQNATQNLNLKHLLLFLSTDANSKNQLTQKVLRNKVTKLNFKEAQLFNMSEQMRIGFITTIEYRD